MKRLLFGVLAVLAGILLLGFNLGLLPLEFKHIIFSWQMLLIALGVINIVSKDSWMAGAILISIGGFFILPKLSIFPFSLDAIIVPGILITIGSIVIIKRAFFPNYRRDWRNQWEQKKNMTI